MLAGLIHLVACHALAALRARAAERGWPELVGQVIDQVGDAACMLCMSLIGLAAIALCAGMLLPIGLGATVLAAVRLGRLLGKKAITWIAAAWTTVRKAAP